MTGGGVSFASESCYLAGWVVIPEPAEPILSDKPVWDQGL